MYTSPTAQVDFTKIATQISTVAPPTPKVSLLDKILGIGTKVTDFGNKAADTASKFQSVINPYLPSGAANSPAASGYTYTAPGAGNDPKQDTGMSTTAKVVIGVGIAAAVTGLVVLATSGKKKAMNGLGELNTAKTKAGKVKQRKAVFAKLDSEGKTYPKNRNGVRKAKTKKRK